MSTDLKKVLDNYRPDDLEAARDRDFSFWVYDMQNRLQSLYDEILVNNEPTPKRQAALDVAFMEITIAIEKAEKLVKDLE